MQEGPHGPRVFISYLTEKLLLDFLTAELDLQLRLEALARQLATKPDWNPHAGFRMVDNAAEGVLNYRNIQDFLRSLGHYAADQQVIAIVRRFDSDADQVIRMPEFLEFITPSDRVAVDTTHALHNMIGRGHSPQRVRIGAGGRISPIRAARSGSPLRHSTAKSVRFAEESPSKPSVLMGSVRKSASVARIGGSPLRSSPPRRPMPPMLARYAGYSSSSATRVTRVDPPMEVINREPLAASPIKASISASQEAIVRAQAFRNASPLRKMVHAAAHSTPVRDPRGSPVRMIPTATSPYGVDTHVLHEKYRRILDLEAGMSHGPTDQKGVSRRLAAFSEKKKERMKYADPDDHQFNWSSKFVDRG